MTIEILDKQATPKGVIYSIKASGKILKVLFLSHAIERIKKWGISEEMAAETLVLPEEVVTGHRNRYIAHRRYGDHIIRAVYEYEGMMPALVTVYFPYAERYFKGGGIYEDQILS
jgi:hypothetical protein